MTGGIPRRPTGASAQAKFVQWVWDSLVLHSRAGRTSRSKVSRTSTGVFVEPLESESQEGGSRVKQYVLKDATKRDYFICRSISRKVDESAGDNPEAITPPLTQTIGATDVFIAKPFHLRQTLFDRDVLNLADPTMIGTVDEINYHVSVESWNGVTFTSTMKKFSFEYKSATFRIAKDETDATPANWTTQNQTIIPRFVPAVLAVADGQPITTATIAPTIIYAVQRSSTGVTRPDNASLPFDEQTPLPVTLLALNDGWAWAKTS